MWEWRAAPLAPRHPAASAHPASRRVVGTTFPRPTLIGCEKCGVAVQGLVLQNPMRIGGDALKAFVAHLQGKPVEKRIDTGVLVVTKENMATPASSELLRSPLEKYLK